MAYFKKSHRLEKKVRHGRIALGSLAIAASLAVCGAKVMSMLIV